VWRDAYNIPWLDVWWRQVYLRGTSLTHTTWCFCVTWLIQDFISRRLVAPGISMCDMTDKHSVCVYMCNMTHTSFPRRLMAPGISMCDMTRTFICLYIYMWHDSSIVYLFVTWLIQHPVSRRLMVPGISMCDMAHTAFSLYICVGHDLRVCVTWLIQTWDMTHWYVWHDSLWRIYTCDMMYVYVWHDSFICVPWLIHMCDMTYSYAWHVAFIRVA